MVCGLDTKDALAKRLKDDDGLIILGRGFPLSKFKPGMILRQPSNWRDSRGPVLVSDPGTLFINWPELEVTEDEYYRLDRDDWSSAIAMKFAADFAPTLTGDEEGAAALAAEMAKSNSSSFNVALQGARLWQIDEAVFENAAKQLRPQKVLAGYRNDGQRIFLVTHALSVTAALIKLNDKTHAKALADATVSKLGKAGVSGEVDHELATAVSINAGSSEIMIAYRCVEVVMDDMANILRLREATRVRTVRDHETRESTEYAKREDFDDRGSLLIHLEEEI